MLLPIRRLTLTCVDANVSVVRVQGRSSQIGYADRVLRGRERRPRTSTEVLRRAVRLAGRGRPGDGGLRPGRHRLGGGCDRWGHRAVRGTRRHGSQDLRPGARPPGVARPCRGAGRDGAGAAHGPARRLRPVRAPRRPGRQPGRAVGLTMSDDDDDDAGSAPDPGAEQATDEALRALAEPRRRAILRLVAHEELPAGQIAEAFDVTRTAVSQHLSVLRNAGLLHERRDGTRRLYRARPEGLAGLQAFLDQMWATSLHTAARLVEAERGITEHDDAAAAG